MVTLTDALALAQTHLIEMNEVAPIHPNYQYGTSKPTEYAHCWYFDYSIQPRLDFLPCKREMFAGAPGFTVSKQTAELHTISWYEMQKLAKQSAIWLHCELTAKALLGTNLSLTVLRSHFPVDLPELVAFKKDLEKLGTDKLARKEVLKAKLLQLAGFFNVL
ncbi:hypothetical protein GCM10022409_04050 [Hymenobacter glaciei]|uniref:Uncharacterized protein n=1 Tax=Hymenobacter glaciei TaxID=877209 RepID=A0ABP7TAQ9_9BACT